MLLLFVGVVFTSSFVLAAIAALAASRVLDREGDGSGEPLAILKTDEVSSITVWGNLLRRFDFSEGMRTRLAEADISWSVGRLTALMLLMGTFTLASLSWLPLWIALVVAGSAAATPYLYVLRRRNRRLAEFSSQFPDALDFLSRSLRAGHPLTVSIELLSQEETGPLAAEMRRTADERRLGAPLDKSLDNLARRIPLINVRLFVAAVKLQSRTGGRLSEVLGGLAETMREAAMVEGEVQALAAHGRVTGTVLTALPIFIALMLTWVNPGYLSILFESQIGRMMTGGCAAALVVAHFVIRKIVDVKI